MATAEPRRRPFADYAVPVLLTGGVAVALAVVLAVRRSGGEDATDAPAPVAIEATGPRYGDLAAMTTASDLVVVGAVASTARGRLVGDPAGGAVVSRFVTVQVDEVLHGELGTGSSQLVLEEEGWLADGTPIAVNGLAPSEPGDRALWFLDRIDTGDGQTYVVVNEQGRFLDDGGRSVGADTEDPLIEQVEQMTFTATVAEVRQVAVR